MKKVAFHNLGCKVNSYELDGIQQTFQKNGYEIVDFTQKADVYVVNTCTVTNIADRKSRQMLHRAKAMNPDAVVVATGCYVQTDTEGAIRDDAVDLIVGNHEKADLYHYVERFLENHADKTLSGESVSDISKSREYEKFEIYKSEEHTRAYMKIQDGCNQFCTYCAIPLARGRVRSRSKEDIIAEAARLADNGYREVVLTGIHLSSYGLDGSYNAFTEKEVANEALLDVIEAVAGIKGLARIRLGSLEPRLISHDFAERLSANEKVCPHFHLSLQSGADTVLERMNRHYTADEFYEKTEILRSVYEHPAITTDIITGFPMETDEEFSLTRDFLNKVNLYETHVFKYSRRRGTKADEMKGQLTDRIKSERSSILIADSDIRKQEFAKYYVGKKVSVLTEDEEVIDGINYRVGFTPEYVKCALKADPYNQGIVQRYAAEAKEGILFLS